MNLFWFSLFQAADDLLALTNTETPLKGGTNAPLHSTDFTAPSNVRQAIQTPNTVLSVYGKTPGNLYDRMFWVYFHSLHVYLNLILETPGTVAETPGAATPFRDQLNINKGAEKSSIDDLRRQLKNLPTPKNDFEVVIPDEVEEKEEPMDTDWVEDASEIDAKKAVLLEKKKQKELAARTEVFRRNLPKPSKLNEAFFKRVPVKNPYDEVCFVFLWQMNDNFQFFISLYCFYKTVPVDLEMQAMTPNVWITFIVGTELPDFWVIDGRSRCVKDLPLFGLVDFRDCPPKLNN